MDIHKVLSGDGYDIPNPEYNPKTKKGRLQPLTIKTDDQNKAHPFINQTYNLNKNEAYIFNAADNIKYIKGGINLNNWEDPNSWDKQLAESQSAWSKLGNSVAQTAVSEVVLGTLKGITDLFDVVSGAAFQSDNDYSNPASEYLAGLQEDFRNSHPIYTDPNVNISNGGLLDVGWWASNMPSIASSLTLLIPSTGVTKGLSWLGKALNIASGGKLGKFGKAAYRGMTGAGKVKSLEEARKLNGVTKWLNSSSGKTVMKNMVEHSTNAAIMRTIENYQEAGQVYDDMKQRALDKFNSISDEEYNNLVNQNADKLEGVDTSDKNAVAERIAALSADETFKMDYVNTLFDVIQLYSLKNPLNFAKSRFGTRAINKAQRKSTEAMAEKLATTTQEGVEKVASKSVIKNFGRNAWDFVKDSARPIVAESTEGIEEAVNYIAQEEGMHYGNTILGDDVNNGFTSRLASYLRSPELYDAAFWGVMGGVVFQGAGSGINRLYTAAERAYENRKKKPDEKTGEAVNKESWQDLFTTSETKRRVADINKRQEDYELLATRMAQINDKDNPVDPFNVDENGDSIALVTEEEKEIARNRAINDYITGMTFRAMDAGNFNMLKAYLKNENVRASLEQAMGLENDGGAFIDSLITKMDDIANKYNENLIMLSGLTSAVNIKSSKDIPIEYLQIIARDNTAAQLRMEDLDKAVGLYDVSSENEKKKYGDKLDQSLDYKAAVNLVTLTTKLAQLKQKKANLEKDKSKKGIGKQIELDEVNENIKTVENLILNQEGISETDAMSKLVYAHIQSDIMNGKNDEEKRKIQIERTLDIAELNLENIIGERAKDFKLTDENIIKMFGEDRTSGSYGTLASDIDGAFGGTYGLNHIDKRLSEDYTYLSVYNMEKAMLGESMVLNDSSLNKRVNELHNSMLDSRTTAISKAYDILKNTAKKYGFDSVSVNLYSGQEINWENDRDKLNYENALQVLNLTSKNNRQLYDQIQRALIDDMIKEAGRNAEENATTETGESSTTSQNQNAEAQPQQTINQSQQNGQTPIGQVNTLNPAQSGQGQQGQGQNQTTNISDEEIITNMENADTASMSYDDLNNNLREAVRINNEARTTNNNNLANRADAVFKKLQLERYNRDLADASVPEDAYKLVNTTNHYVNTGVVSISWTGTGYEGYDKNGQRIESGSMSADEFERLTGVKPSTNSSTGGIDANDNTRFDENGNTIPDENRESIKREISRTIQQSVKNAKDNKTDVTEAINEAVLELNKKYGNDEEFKNEINRMSKSWANMAQKKGWVKDISTLVTLASSIEEDDSGKYKFVGEWLKQTEQFVDKFASKCNAKTYDGKTIISLESILRFANQQMEDNTTAEYIYRMMKEYFKYGPNKDKYIVVDNMDSSTILDRAALSDREIIARRAEKSSVIRVNINNAIENVASRQAINVLEVGSTLEAKIEGKAIILYSNGVAVGSLPNPNVTSDGGFSMENDGWITDVSLSGNTVNSKIKNIFRDILLTKSPINDKINSYAYQILAINKGIKNPGARKVAIENIMKTINEDKDLSVYFDQLRKDGYVGDKTNNYILINGISKLWDYIDLNVPDVNRRERLVDYSLNLWFDKLYESYSTINDAQTAGIDNFNITVDKITDGDVIQVANNDDNGYPKCTIGNDNDAFAEPDKVLFGTVQNNIGVITTTNNEQISMPTAKQGPIWAIFPNRSGIPGIIRGHMMRFDDTDENIEVDENGKVIKTTKVDSEARKIKEAIKLEVKRRLKDFVDNDNWEGLIEIIDSLYNTNNNTPLLSPVGGGKAKVKRDATSLKIGLKVGNGYVNFNIDAKTGNYWFEDNNYKQIYEEDFVNDFIDKVINNSMFNADWNYFNSDSSVGTTINGLATRNAAGEFVITIPNGTDTPSVFTFKSFKEFAMQGGGARWNTINKNGSNFTPKSGVQTRNQILNVKVEVKSSLPVEENVTTSSVIDSINDGTVVDELLKKVFPNNINAIKRLQEAGLIPKDIKYTPTITEKGGNPVYAEYHVGPNKIYVNDRWIELYKEKPEQALRKLIHENLHRKLHSKGNRRKETLKRLREIYDEFVASTEKLPKDSHINAYKFENLDNVEAIEEFLVESLTNAELATYLNSVKSDVPGTKTKRSVLDKILDLLAEIFDWGVEKGSLYEKELRVLQGYTNEEIEGKNSTTRKEPVQQEFNFEENEETQEVQNDNESVEDEVYTDDFEEDESVDEFGASVQERTVPTVNQFIESLPLSDRNDFTELLQDGTVSISCR